jgi:hypothetical protein
VHERLAREMRERDARHRLTRDIRCETAGPMTRGQLVARARLAAGEEPRRHTVGAYRWSDQKRAAVAGRVLPRRLVPKRSGPAAGRIEEAT